MKTILAFMAVLVVLPGCGIRDRVSQVSSMAREMGEVVEGSSRMIAETQKVAKAFEAAKGKPVEDIAMQALRAIRDADAGELRGIVLPLYVLEINSDWITNKYQSRMEGWDGRIREIRYGSCPASGLPQAHVHYMTVDGTYRVHLLDYIEGHWLALGGFFSGVDGFREMSAEDFKALSAALPE